MVDICLLLTGNMTVPENIEMLHDFGNISMIGNEEKIIQGKHIIVRGCVDNIKLWLRPYGEIWVGEGAVQLQHFRLKKVGD